MKGTETHLAPELIESDESDSESETNSVAVAHLGVAHSKETDVWAFGMTVYVRLHIFFPSNILWKFIKEIVVGQEPFKGKIAFVAISKGKTPKFEAMPSCTPDTLHRRLKQICQRCWTRSPALRPNMLAILAELEDDKTLQVSGISLNDDTTGLRDIALVTLLPDEMDVDSCASDVVQQPAPPSPPEVTSSFSPLPNRQRDWDFAFESSLLGMQVISAKCQVKTTSRTLSAHTMWVQVEPCRPEP